MSLVRIQVSEHVVYGIVVVIFEKLLDLHRLVYSFWSLTHGATCSVLQSFMPQSAIILLHGLPATGKTTFGREIAVKLSVPFISRDTYKEILFDVLGGKDGDVAWSKKLGAASFEITYTVIEQMLAGNTTCVFETYWKRKFAESKLKELTEKYSTKIIQVFFYTDPLVRHARHEKRARVDRHPVHMDLHRLQTSEMIQDTIDNEEDDTPLRVPGVTIAVDTTDIATVDIGTIVLHIQSTMKE